MAFLRAITRMAICLASIVPFVVIWIIALPVTFWSPVRDRNFRIRSIRAWSRLVARVIGLRVEYDGTPPQRPFVLVANHVSYVDIIVIYHFLQAVFIAKSDMARWPVLGTVFRITPTLFIDRAQRAQLIEVIGRARRRLAEGFGIVLFPEGTTSDGTRVMNFRPALLQIAIDDGRPVHVASLSYSHPHATWGDEISMPHHLMRLLRVRRFVAHVRFGEAIAGGDRKALADRLRLAVEQNLRRADTHNV